MRHEASQREPSPKGEWMNNEFHGIWNPNQRTQTRALYSFFYILYPFPLWELWTIRTFTLFILQTIFQSRCIYSFPFYWGFSPWLMHFTWPLSLHVYTKVNCSSKMISRKCKKCWLTIQLCFYLFTLIYIYSSITLGLIVHSIDRFIKRIWNTNGKKRMQRY